MVHLKLKQKEALSDLMRRGVMRVRKEVWANPAAYMSVHLSKQPDGTHNHGPWAKLWDRKTQTAIEEPTPQTMLIFGSESDDQFVPYDGPLDPDDKEAIR